MFGKPWEIVRPQCYCVPMQGIESIHDELSALAACARCCFVCPREAVMVQVVIGGKRWCTQHPGGMRTP